MPDGSPALLKTRKHLRREKAEGMWKDLVRKGWEKVPAVRGSDAEHRLKKCQSVFWKRNQTTLQKFGSLSHQLRRSKS